MPFQARQPRRGPSSVPIASAPYAITGTSVRWRCWASRSAASLRALPVSLSRRAIAVWVEVGSQPRGTSWPSIRSRNAAESGCGTLVLRSTRSNFARLARIAVFAGFRSFRLGPGQRSAVWPHLGSSPPSTAGGRSDHLLSALVGAPTGFFVFSVGDPFAAAHPLRGAFHAGTPRRV
jgi:hypothetical protein